MGIAREYCNYYVVRNYAINFLLRELPALLPTYKLQ